MILTSPRAIEALRHLEDSVGGRDGLIDTLVLAKLDDRQQHFLRMLADPARATDSLATLCRDAALKPNDLIEMYRSASFAKANALAIGRAATAIPAIVDDLADKSVDRVVMCRACRGTLVDSAGGRCPACAGKGTMVLDSDLARQHTLLDMLGLGRKAAGGATIINTNAQINQTSVGSLFSSFVKATDRAAYAVDTPPTDVVEGELGTEG